jgi:thioredoxin-related protein
MRNILLSLSLVLLSTLSYSQRIKVIEVADLEEYEEVLGITRNTQQLLFVILNNEGEGLDRMLQEDVFDDPAVQAEMKKTVPVIVQLRTDMGSRLAQTFAPTAFPAIYIMNAEETVLGQTQGYVPASTLLNNLKQAVENNAQYASLKEGYSQKSLSKPAWRKLLDIYALNHSFVETQELALEYFALLSPEEKLQKENLSYEIAYGLPLESTYPDFLWKNRAQIKRTFPDFEEDAFFESVYGYNLNLAVLNQDSVLLEQLLSTWVSNTPKEERAALRLETQKFYAEETKQFARYAIAVEQFIAESDSSFADTAEFLYDEAFYLADNYATASAQQAARNLSLRAYSLSTDFRYKMLAGYMSFLLKDYELAEKQVGEAKAISDLPANTRKANSLLEMIEKEKGKESGPINYER